MRAYELYGQLPTMISGEEEDFIKRLSDKSISEEDLDERDQQIATRLTSRGLINRTYKKSIAKYSEFPKARRL